MSSFRYSICNPFSPEIIEKGAISKEDFINIFKEFPWVDLLNESKEAESSESGKKVHYSPSLEIENSSNKNGLSISIAEVVEQPEFYIFYKRPELRRFFLGYFKSSMKTM